MLTQRKFAYRKRAEFREALDSGRLLQFPGAFTPVLSLVIEELKFDGIYISGAGLAQELGVSRLCLHAGVLRLTHPRSGEALEFTSPLPVELQRALAAR